MTSLYSIGRDWITQREPERSFAFDEIDGSAMSRTLGLTQDAAGFKRPFNVTGIGEAG